MLTFIGLFTSKITYNLIFRHSTTDIIDDVSIFCDSSQNSLIEGEQQKQCSFSPSSHKKFQQIERRHSLTERSPREYYDARPDFGTLVSDPGTGIIHDYMKDELKEKQQQSVQQNFEVLMNLREIFFLLFTYL